MVLMSNNNHVAGDTCDPLVLPDIFSRDGDVNEWIGCFERVPVVNSWDDKSKLQWSCVYVAPQVAIAMRQRHPKTITEAVQATIELETYLPARKS